MKACLLGCTTATQNAQVTFVNIAVAISALAGGGGGGHSKNFAPSPYIAGVSAFFRRFFGVGDQDGLEIEFWVILVPLWLEFWVVLVGLWCNFYSGSFKEYRARPLYRWCLCVFSTIFWGWRSRRSGDWISGHFGASVARILGRFGGSLVQFLLGFIQRASRKASISLVFSRFFDGFLRLEIKTVLRSNFGSFWCLCGPNFGSFWWLSGAIPTLAGLLSRGKEWTTPIGRNLTGGKKGVVIIQQKNDPSSTSLGAPLRPRKLT